MPKHMLQIPWFDLIRKADEINMLPVSYYGFTVVEYIFRVVKTFFLGGIQSFGN